MNEYVIAIFSDEANAAKGVQALEALHAAGTLTVYGTIVVRRDANGDLTIEQRSEQGPATAGVGSLLGGLIGLFGARAGAFWRDHLRTEVSDEFLDDVVRELVPDKHAVIAEVSRDSSTSFDAPIEALGGTVLRERRDDLSADLIEKRVGSRTAELAEWKAQRAAETVEKIGSTLEAEIEQAQARLQRMAETAKQRLHDTKAELEAKLDALDKQAAKAKIDVKAQIERRMDDLRKELHDRQKKLAHAWEEARQALLH